MMLTVVFLLAIALACVESTKTFRDVLIVAGNFSIDDEFVNIAQYDIVNKEWSKDIMVNLYLYGLSNGVVWDIAVNRSESNEIGDEVFVVGDFDTVSESSQIQYCSVGKWNGAKFDKVGQGLCLIGESYKTVHIETSVVGNNGDVFVGGTFETRVWNGRVFVNVNHVAMYDARSDSWLPLPQSNGQLGCRDGSPPRVTALAWDRQRAILFIGGYFDMFGGSTISSGLAMWSATTGVISFYGTGVTRYSQAPQLNGMVQSLSFSETLQTLVIAGDFAELDGQPCRTIGIWVRSENKFVCLYDESHAISAVTSVFLDDDKGMLYLSGWASDVSTWVASTYLTPYAIARFSILHHFFQKSFNGVSPSIRRSNEMQQRKSIPKPSSQRLRNPPVGFSDSNKTIPRHWRRLNARRATLRGLRNNLDEFYYFNDPGTPPVWEWLPGFIGGNGPILRLTKGVGKYDGHLFISGAFNNFPSVVAIWSEANNASNITTAPEISFINNKHAIQGLVTALAQVRMPYSDEIIINRPTRPPVVYPSSSQLTWDYVLFIVGCVLVGLGVLMGLMFSYRASTDAAYNKVSSNGDDSGQGNEVASTGSISLATLSGNGMIGVDFRKTFEKAMKLRHLPANGSLQLVNPREIELVKIIGEGSFGRVWIGQWRQDSVAVKEFVFAQAAVFGGSMERQKIIEEIIGEAGIMSCLRHQKILQVYGCSLSMQAIWIVTELCRRGSLRMLLDDRSVNLTLLQRLSICMDIADGMMYLHDMASPIIIHRDLKSQNIFIQESGPETFVAKIGDWGSARAVALTNAKSMTQGVGTACWLAPEVIKFAHFSKQSDIYAYGIVLWEIFTRMEVYSGYSAAQIISKVAHEGLRPLIPPYCPWADIMSECWSEDPKLRPQFSTILATLTTLYEREKNSKDFDQFESDVSGWELELPPSQQGTRPNSVNNFAAYQANVENTYQRSTQSASSLTLSPNKSSVSSPFRLWQSVDDNPEQIQERKPKNHSDLTCSSGRNSVDIAGGYDTT